MTKIITEGYPKGNEILLDKISCTYYQENDCTESKDEGQKIVIETRDGGGGKFLNIKTDSWSIEEPNELLNLINDFKKRIGEDSSNT